MRTFNKLIGILKGPIDFDESRIDITSSISLWVIGDKNIEVEFLFLKAGLHMQLFMCDFMQLITSTKLSHRVAYVNACATCCNFHPATYCDLVQPATYLGLRSYVATKLQ